MRSIPLKPGMLLSKRDKLKALVDDEDFLELSKFKWFAMKTVDGNIYARRAHGSKMITMHRVVLKLKENAGKVDHKDTNSLNNQKQNLRLANDHQNQANRNKNSNNTSGFKGVTWCKAARKWQAQIMVHRQHFYLGLFTDPKEAAAVYDKEAIKHFGEFARTNQMIGTL